jgi:hypothetical protein
MVSDHVLRMFREALKLPTIPIGFEEIARIGFP